MGTTIRTTALLLAAALIAWGCAPSGPPEPEESPPEPPARDTPPKEVRPDRLRARIEAAITNVRKRTLLRGNAFWTVFHGILGLGPGVKLVDSRSGETV